MLQNELFLYLKVGGITPNIHDEFAKTLNIRQVVLNERLVMLTNDNKSFQLTASYLLDLSRRANELFTQSDDSLKQKLLGYILSNIELTDKKLTYSLNNPFKSIAEAKKKALSGSNSEIWCGLRDSKALNHCRGFLRA